MVHAWSNSEMTSSDLVERRRRRLRLAADRWFGGNQASLAQASKRQPQQISDMIAGRKSFGEKVARAIEIELAGHPCYMPEGWLDGQDDEHAAHQAGLLASEPVKPRNYEITTPRATVPLISWIQAGELNGVEDHYHPGDAEEWVDAHSSRPGSRAFALRIVGESMVSPTGTPSFPPGSVIIVDPDRAAAPGSFVVAKDVMTQEATFKRLVTDGGRWYLKPLNPAFPAIEVDRPTLRIIGVAIEMIHSVKL